MGLGNINQADRQGDEHHDSPANPLVELQQEGVRRIINQFAFDAPAHKVPDGIRGQAVQMTSAQAYQQWDQNPDVPPSQEPGDMDVPPPALGIMDTKTGDDEEDNDRSRPIEQTIEKSPAHFQEQSVPDKMVVEGRRTDVVQHDPECRDETDAVQSVYPLKLWKIANYDEQSVFKRYWRRKDIPK